MEIRIACHGADTMPLDELEDFQNTLKKRTKRDIELIIKSLEKYGFSFPFFVWKHDGHNYCLDGHGRIQALHVMREKGYKLPEFPVDYIEADSIEEAKQKLLRLNSSYGQMTFESVVEFAGDMEIDWSDLALPSANYLYDQDKADFSDEEFGQSREVNISDKTCPNCGYVLGKKVNIKRGENEYFGNTEK